LTYSVSVEVTAVSGTLVYGDIILAGSSTYIGWYKDGVFQATSTSTPVTTGVITLIFTANSDNTILRLGLGSAGTNVTGSVTLRYPQFQQGQVPLRTYYPNSSTSVARFDSARFDYDPTTLAPRGLLIEGSANNLAFWSENINPNASPQNVYWTVSGTGASVTPTSQADPANGTSASRCVLGTSAVGRVYQGITTTAGITYTLSFWAKSVSGTTALAIWHFNSATGNSTAVTVGTSWTRYQVTILGRTGGGFVECGIVNLTSNAATVDLWGLQLETGSGASSYIPTGASTATRNADKMSLLDITPMQWNQTDGTFVLSMDVAAETNTTSFPAAWGMYTATPVRVIRNLINNSSGTNPRLFVDTWTSAPTQIFSQSISRPASPALTKFAFALSNSGQAIAMCVNNGAITTGSGTGTMQTPTRLLFHQDPSATDTEYFPIHIRSFKYWPTSLSNAQLQSLTT
jgi:hypothetical protein